MEAADEVRAWAASGALALTGTVDRPLGPPAGFVTKLRDLAATIAGASSRLGRPVEIDPLGVLVERAAVAGLGRRGRVSCGGGTRLLRAADGWVAVSLARPDDLDLLPAWIGVTATVGDDEAWGRVSDAVRRRTGAQVVGDGAQLGLPVALLGETPTPGSGSVDREVGTAPPTTDLRDVRVVDLTSLWAGPLCGSVLADAGAEVVKVESSRRPDGARSGPPAFFDLMNAGKRSVAVDFTTPEGRRHLETLVRSAEVVLEASRPRAMEQLGIDADELLESPDGPRVWVSITGHGIDARGRDRVGFGDDAAVAGGLVAWDDDEPQFCSDAVADPVSGLVAADVVLDRLAHGGRWRVDVALSRTAAACAGPTLEVPDGYEPVPPRSDRSRGRARPMGADTAAVLASAGVGG